MAEHATDSTTQVAAAGKDRPAWAGCLAEPAREFGPAPCPVRSGTLPDGLRGTLYRNGPARLERGGLHVGHWFDGDGAVLAVSFDGAGAVATYRYVRGAGLEAEEKAGRLLFGNYGMAAPGPFWNHWRRPLKNAANTSVLALPDRLLALWEGGPPHALGLDDLHTIGLDDLGGTLTGHGPYSAHPKLDAATGEVFNFGVRIGGPNATLRLYRSDRSGRILAEGRHRFDGVPFIHDFALAGDYLVFLSPPVRIAVLGVLLGLESYADAMRWRPELGTEVLVFDRNSLKLVARGETGPFYQWHFGNGAVDGHGQVLLDLARYADFSTNQHLREVPFGRTTTPTEARLWRLRIDPKTGRIEEAATLAERSVEFPMVAPREVGRPATRSWMLAHRPDTDSTAERYDGWLAIDHADGRVEPCDPGGRRYPNEPGIAADADGERDWMLSVVYDGEADESSLWVFDAARIGDGPVCVLELPGNVPLGFHGCWRPAAAPR